MHDMSAVLGTSMRAVFRPATGELLLTFSCNGISITLSTMQGPVLEQQQQARILDTPPAAAALQASIAGSAEVRAGRGRAAGKPSSPAVDRGDVGDDYDSREKADSSGTDKAGAGRRESGAGEEVDGGKGDAGGGSEVSALLARAKALMADTAAADAQEAATRISAG